MGTMNKSIYTTESDKLGAWLREQRESRGLTMRQVAQVINEPHTFVGKIETGHRRLDVIEFVWYCKIMGFDAVEGLSVIQEYVDKVGLPS
jgi:transcriptional regulator with XRE-family HTH domain